MANSKDQLVNDVSFIFEECARQIRMVEEGRFRDIPREDAFCDLPHPTHNWPTGKMLCSRAGFDRLETLTVKALKQAELENRVSLQPARSVMGEILVRKFVREKRAIETKQIDRAMSEMVKRCRKTCDDLTHYIPCHLMSPQSPASFQIGPVRFLNQATFRSTLAKHIWSNRRRDRWRADVKRAYDIRSKLVHGALSPSSDIVYEGVRLGAQLARDALLSATTLLGEAGFRDDAASNRQLGRWYDRLVTHADATIERHIANQKLISGNFGEV